MSRIDDFVKQLRAEVDQCSLDLTLARDRCKDLENKLISLKRDLDDVSSVQRK